MRPWSRRRRRIQPTYEELKPWIAEHHAPSPLSIQPTYEELKLEQGELNLSEEDSIQPTYEELKRMERKIRGIDVILYPAYL